MAMPRYRAWGGAQRKHLLLRPLRQSGGRPAYATVIDASLLIPVTTGPLASDAVTSVTKCLAI
jgi:hypothetical protein